MSFACPIRLPSNLPPIFDAILDSEVTQSAYTYSAGDDGLGDLEIDDVEVCDRLRQLTQQKDDDDDDKHYLQLQRQVAHQGPVYERSITQLIITPW